MSLRSKIIFGIWAIPVSWFVLTFAWIGVASVP